jgi:hypothetical protein
VASSRSTRSAARGGGSPAAEGREAREQLAARDRPEAMRPPPCGEQGDAAVGREAAVERARRVGELREGDDPGAGVPGAQRAQERGTRLVAPRVGRVEQRAQRGDVRVEGGARGLARGRVA